MRYVEGIVKLYVTRLLLDRKLFQHFNKVPIHLAEPEPACDVPLDPPVFEVLTLQLPVGRQIKRKGEE